MRRRTTDTLRRARPVAHHGNKSLVLSTDAVRTSFAYRSGTLLLHAAQTLVALCDDIAVLVSLLFMPSTSQQNQSFRPTGKMQSQAGLIIQHVLHWLMRRDVCKSKAATERSKTLPTLK